MALLFRDDETLRVVLMSGLCPPDIQAKGAHVARDAKGALILAPEGTLSKDALAKLRAAGVATDAQLPAGARAVRTWAEAVALVRVPVTETPALVMITTAEKAGVVDLSAELLRLGCERQELLVTPAGGLARVLDPPTYTIVRAMDRESGLRAYVPDPPGQDAVWTELGFKHPLAARLRAEPGHVLLVSTDGWRNVRDDGWKSLESALELAVPGAHVELAAAPIKERRRVELRLSPGRREAPSLWVIRTNGLQAIDRLLEYLPEDIVARLTFAASTHLPLDSSAHGSSGVSRVTHTSSGSIALPTTSIIIRARTGRHGPPDLSLDAEEYAPLSNMPDVYAPAGSIVEPPLRRERLRQIIGVDQGAVAWLAPIVVRPTEGALSVAQQVNRTRGPFRVERIPDNAFVPLSEWADYVIHASATELQPWSRSAVFDFASFVSTGLEWSQSPPPSDDRDKPDKNKDKDKRRPARGRAAAPPPVVVAAAAPAPAPRTPRKSSDGETPVEEVTVDAELAALEAQFVALDAPADAPERLELLEQLGRAYARLNRRRDAGLCFARAVWEQTGAAANERLDAWLTADLGKTDPARALEQILAMTAPGLDDVRRVATIAARAAQAVAKDPHRVHRWLDDHDGELDARTLWLARVGLARLAGGDTLGLAQTRDRILARLAGGLPVERELPSFLRFSGRSGALGNASGEHLGKALVELQERVTSTRRKRSPVEAPVAHTTAYVGFQLAHGFARIGQPERARTIVAESRTALAAVIADPVHAYLAAAYTARVEQAVAGQPPETPLPDPLGAQLAALDRVARYKVDRLREASHILEPLERPDAIGAFSKRVHDARGPEFAALRAITEAAARAKEVSRLTDLAGKSDDAEKGRLLDGIFDVLLELPESGAAPILGRAWPLVATLPEPKRAVLYAEALVVAGHFGRTELVPEMLEHLGTAVRAVPGNELDRVLDKSLRALRRIGLRAEIAELLADVEHALEAGSTHLRARLAIAAGLAFLGETARALPILEQGRKALDDSMTLTVRLETTRALAQAYAQAPIAHALAGITDLAGQLRDITDSFGTNSHYCLSVLHFVESLVLGITSDDLALGEAGRRFVEDDEHLIRRRLHRDLGGSA